MSGEAEKLCLYSSSDTCGNHCTFVPQITKLHYKCEGGIWRWQRKVLLNAIAECAEKK